MSTLTTSQSAQVRALSPREREIFQLLAQGLNGNEIAARLILSGETVRAHVRNGARRLGARTRVHALALAVSRQEISLAGPSDRIGVATERPCHASGEPWGSENEEPVLDGSSLHDVCADDAELRERITNAYLDQAGAAVTALGDAIEQADTPAISRGAHALKGSSATIGAHRMAAICETLDRSAAEEEITRTAALHGDLQRVLGMTKAALPTQRDERGSA